MSSMAKPMRYAMLGLLISTQAAAQQVCGARKDIIEQLGKQFGETSRFEGINNAGEYLEILLSTKSGTFTLIATRPGGLTCVVDAGLGNMRKNFDYGPQLNN